MKIFERTHDGEVLALARLLNVTEGEVLERARDIQPDLKELKEISDNTYAYLMGFLIGRQHKVVG